MISAPIVLISAAVLAVAYLIYGRFLTGVHGFDCLISGVLRRRPGKV